MAVGAVAIILLWTVGLLAVVGVALRRYRSDQWSLRAAAVVPALFLAGLPWAGEFVSGRPINVAAALLGSAALCVGSSIMFWFLAPRTIR